MQDKREALEMEQAEGTSQQQIEVDDLARPSDEKGLVEENNQAETSSMAEVEPVVTETFVADNAAEYFQGNAEVQQDIDADEEDMDQAELMEAFEREHNADATMSFLMRDLDQSFRSFRRGDMVEGPIVSIDKDGMMVDIGTKSEAFVPGHEATRYAAEGKTALKVGDIVVACVIQPENSEGHVVLSLSRARVERGWRDVQKIFEAAESAEADIVDHNKGGLIVSIESIRGFVPISQIVGLRQNVSNEEEIENRLAAMVGNKVSVKVLEINRRRNRLILSERAALRETRAARKDQLLSELHEGEVRQGRVSSICDFGAFIDLGGADGLVHLSELSWGQISQPSEVVHVGEQVNVYVLSVDQEKKKIALSIRRSQPEPWTTVADRYQPGDIVTATVTKLATFGAFAKVEPGVEGLIHVSELAEGHVAHPSKVVKEGDIVTVRIIRVDATKKRLGLSLRQAHNPDDEPTEDVSEPASVVDEAFDPAAIPVTESEDSVAGATTAEAAPEVEIDQSSTHSPDGNPATSEEASISID